MLFALSGVTLVLFLMAHWVMPLRLLSAPNGYYVPGYLGDEHSYLQRMQPLLPGTTRASPLNGLGDQRIVSMIFQDDILRASISASGMHVITFFWIWRFAFIFIVLLAMALLARVCFERRRLGTRPPWLALALLGTAILYGLYNFLLPNHPPHLFLNRVPTNMEFVTSTLLLCAAILFFRKPSLRNALLMAGAVTLNLYLRPYVLPAWVAPIACLCLYVVYRDRRALRSIALFIAACALASLPWLLVSQANAAIPAHVEWSARYFRRDEYGLHPRWPWHLAAGALLMSASAFLLCGQRRILALVLGSGFLILPFVTGYPGLANQLNVREDRFGCYFLPVIAAIVFMTLSSTAERWRGKLAIVSAAKMSYTALACTVIVALYYGVAHATFDVRSYPLGNYQGIAEDAELLPAYTWIRQHTPADALFIVDDAFDWEAIQRNPSLYDQYRLAKYTSGEYFCVMAERRCTFAELLWSFPYSNREVDELYLLQQGTFGKECSPQTYGRIFKQVKPTHILWRKKSGVGRGMGERLRALATTVYTDPVCEIWAFEKM